MYVQQHQVYIFWAPYLFIYVQSFILEDLTVLYWDSVLPSIVRVKKNNIYLIPLIL